MFKINGKKESHYGMRIQYENRWLYEYYPMPIVRVRHPNISGRVFWIIPKAIPEYHNSQNYET